MLPAVLTTTAVYWEMEIEICVCAFVHMCVEVLKAESIVGFQYLSYHMVCASVNSLYMFCL